MEKDIGTPQFVGVHKSGWVFWSGLPDGGTRRIVPGGAVAILAPKISHSYGVGFSPKQDWLYVAPKLSPPRHSARCASDGPARR